ncbi:hypothetical protein [Pseudomonas phage pPA-3099-2aT.2]|uniref:Uncharacterized protein n=1 Tax=Pseudomonas phage pPA-3099-2aT.2 TaxID=3003808 RepID=A0AAE9W5E3_9CAUD|nr:hypothetical protein QE325_gp124 [Pseudomonas phage pPA-3099-2aT.2]WBQ35257.1 hypothetical protein [Pseudomonas phage pPA-3099-2aT.2]
MKSGIELTVDTTGPSPHNGPVFDKQPQRYPK